MEQILIQQLQMQQERYNAEIIAATSSSVRSFLSTVPADLSSRLIQLARKLANFQD
jgi:hypothetical protein